MALQWHPLAAPALVSLLAGWILAALVYQTRPDRAQNRWAALCLVLFSTLGACFAGLRLLVVSPADAYGMLAVFVTLNLAGPFVYLSLLSTLDTPLVAWLRLPAVRAALAAYTLLIEAFWLTRSDLFIPTLAWWPEVGGWALRQGPLFVPFLVVVPVGTLLYALAASWSAHRHATSPAVRRRAASFALAFGIRDLLFGAGIALLQVLAMRGRPVAALNFTLFPLIDLAFALLLAYAVLRTQLFDVDLRIQRGIRQSTVGAFFAGAFFFASEGAEQALAVDGTFYGLAAAAGITLVLRPVQRVAETVATRVLPGVEDTPAYRASRKLEIYRAALEELRADGVLTEADGRVLAHLERRLGLTPEEVASVEGAPPSLPRARP